MGPLPCAATVMCGNLICVYDAHERWVSSRYRPRDLTGRSQTPPKDLPRARDLVRATRANQWEYGRRWMALESATGQIATIAIWVSYFLNPQNIEDVSHLTMVLWSRSEPEGILIGCL